MRVARGRQHEQVPGHCSHGDLIVAPARLAPPVVPADLRDLVDCQCESTLVVVQEGGEGEPVRFLLDHADLAHDVRRHAAKPREPVCGHHAPVRTRVASDDLIVVGLERYHPAQGMGLERREVPGAQSIPQPLRAAIRHLLDPAIQRLQAANLTINQHRPGKALLDEDRVTTQRVVDLLQSTGEQGLPGDSLQLPAQRFARHGSVPA